jgi:hypothetical protein
MTVQLEDCDIPFTQEFGVVLLYHILNVLLLCSVNFKCQPPVFKSDIACCCNFSSHQLDNAIWSGTASIYLLQVIYGVISWTTHLQVVGVT